MKQTNSGITGPLVLGKGDVNLTGQKHGETGYAMPEGIKQGSANETTEAVLDFLNQGLTNLTNTTAMFTVSHWYNEKDCTLGGYRIDCDDPSLLEAALDLVQKILRPALPDVIDAKLVQLFTVLPRQGGVDGKVAILMPTYQEHMLQIPEDVFMEACDFFMKTAKWMPRISEFFDYYENNHPERPLLARAIERKLQSINGDVLQIETNRR